VSPRALIGSLVCVVAACNESPFGSFKNPPGTSDVIGKFVPADSPYCYDTSALGIQQPVGIGNGATYFYFADAASSARKLFALAVPSRGMLQVAASRMLSSTPADVAVADGFCPYVASDTSIDPVSFTDSTYGSCSSSDPPYPLAHSLITFDLGDLLRAGKSDLLLERYVPAAPLTHQESVMLSVTPERITVFEPTSKLLIAYKTGSGWEMLAYDRRPFRLRGRVQFPWPSYRELVGLSGPYDPGDQHLYALSDHQEFCVYSYVPGG